MLKHWIGVRQSRVEEDQQSGIGHAGDSLVQSLPAAQRPTACLVIATPSPASSWAAFKRGKQSFHHHQSMGVHERQGVAYGNQFVEVGLGSHEAVAVGVQNVFGPGFRFQLGHSPLHQVAVAVQEVSRQWSTT